MVGVALVAVRLVGVALVAVREAMVARISSRSHRSRCRAYSKDRVSPS